MKLAEIFRDNMVFQAEKPVRIFGSGKGNISLTFATFCYEVKFAEEEWVWELPAQSYGGPYDLAFKINGSDHVLKNVAFGDVILCAGQSNIQFQIIEEANTSPIDDDEKIRYFVSGKTLAGEDKFPGAWGICKQDAVLRWSALGLHIAQNYRRKKDVYVGVVGCFNGASGIRSWLPGRTLDESVFVPIALRHTDYVTVAVNADSFLYKKDFEPLIPFSFGNVVWYQGESDTTVEEGRVYTELLSRLVTSWREDLLDKTLEFIVVEICDYVNRCDDGWRAIQECQQKIVDVLENVKTVTSKDVCEHSGIHPSNKEKLAEKIVKTMDLR